MLDIYDDQQRPIGTVQRGTKKGKIERRQRRRLLGLR
jgi:hypothetical protein